jgi:hypothetical protein
MHNRLVQFPIKHLVRRIACLVAWVAFGTLVGAATNPPATPGASKAATNTAPADIVIPTSEFIMPASVAEGRDPFFPVSTRSTPVVVNTNTSVKAPTVSLTLQGISGTLERRFALINGRTFEVGEEAEVSAGKSRVHVHCLEIKEDSVTIEVEGKPQELKLRGGR